MLLISSSLCTESSICVMRPVVLLCVTSAKFKELHRRFDSRGNLPTFDVFDEMWQRSMLHLTFAFILSTDSDRNSLNCEPFGHTVASLRNCVLFSFQTLYFYLN